MPTTPASYETAPEVGRGDGSEHLPRGRAAPLAGLGLARTGLRSGWRALLAIALGMLVAVVLVAAVPIFADLAANVQVQATINREDSTTRNIQVQASAIEPDLLSKPQTVTPQLLSAQDDAVRSTANAYLAPFVQPNVTNYLVASPTGIAQLGARALNPYTVANPETQFEAFDYAQASPHMRLLAGRLPQSTTSGPPEALITQQMAQNEGARVGDLLTAVRVAAYGPAGDSFTFTVRIVGIWVPRDVNDDFWSGRSFISVPPCDLCSFVYPVLLDRQALEQELTTIASLNVMQFWVFYSIPTHITTSNLPDTIARIKQFRTQISIQLFSIAGQSFTLTDLDRALSDVRQQLAALGLPLYLVVAQVVGLALLFVATMADVLAQVRAGETATLRSRGASKAQLLVSYAAQGVALAMPISLAGPWLASLLALGLIRWFVPASVLASAHVNLPFLAARANPGAATLPALLGALLALATILLATGRAGTRDVLAFRREQGRAGRPALWRRLYLDIWLALICVAGYVQLSFFGGATTRTLVSQGAGTFLLAAAPGLLLLAGALLLLRGFPLAMALGARLAARGRGAPGMLALAQVTRTNAGPGRLTLLLALVVGLGLFALTYAASLARSASDEASYQAGAEIRLVEQNSVAGQTDVQVQTALVRLPGVLGVSPVDRIATNVEISDQSGRSSGPPVTLLGVDPATWAHVAAPASWRSDYASASPAALMAGLQAHQWGTDEADRSGQTNAGNDNHPIWAIVSANFAQGEALRLGDHFYLSLPGAYRGYATFKVGAIINEFPTLYPDSPGGGFIVVNLNDCLGASTVYTPGEPGSVGPNEYWLNATTDPARRAALLRALNQQRVPLIIQDVVDRAVLRATIAGNPLQVTVAGLLLAGAAIAALLALLGSIIQATSAARLRGLQFAVLRTLGMGSTQLTRMLLGELVAVYMYGLLGGTLLSAVLATATLPYLRFSDTVALPGTQGIPPYVLAINPVTMGLFYLALAVALALTLILTAHAAARVNLDQGLRRAED